MSTWNDLAVEADRWAEYLELRGEFGGAFRNKARLYRSAAEAERLTDATGAHHCACCLKAIGPRIQPPARSTTYDQGGK